MIGITLGHALTFKEQVATVVAVVEVRAGDTSGLMVTLEVDAATFSTFVCWKMEKRV